MPDLGLAKARHWADNRMGQILPNQIASTRTTSTMSSISSSPTLFRSEEDSARTTPEAGPSTAASSPPNHDSSEYVGSGAPSEGSVVRLFIFDSIFLSIF